MSNASHHIVYECHFPMKCIVQSGLLTVFRLREDWRHSAALMHSSTLTPWWRSNRDRFFTDIQFVRDIYECALPCFSYVECKYEQGLVITRLHDYQFLFGMLHGSFFGNRLESPKNYTSFWNHHFWRQVIDYIIPFSIPFRLSWSWSFLILSRVWEVEV